MHIKIDKIETSSRIAALGLKDHFTRTHCEEMYFDTEIRAFFIILKEQNTGQKYSGRVMVPEAAVVAAQVSADSIPVNQPIGTPESHDTPTGRRKKRSTSGGKAHIAERAAARAAAKKSES